MGPKLLFSAALREFEEVLIDVKAAINNIAWNTCCCLSLQDVNPLIFTMCAGSIK